MVDDPKKNEANKQGPGEYHVGPWVIILIMGYLIMFTILLLSSLVFFWPAGLAYVLGLALVLFGTGLAAFRRAKRDFEAAL